MRTFWAILYALNHESSSIYRKVSTILKEIIHQIFAAPAALESHVANIATWRIIRLIIRTIADDSLYILY